MALFADVDDADAQRPSVIPLAPGAVVLRRAALPTQDALLAGVHDVLAAAPPRHMETPGGLRMSVAMSNCGPLGWVSDRRGYRYAAADPLSGAAWPAMPDAFRALARHAAEMAGFPDFEPDACLVNIYEPGARLTLHQDKDERDYGHPIVSVSLGLPAVFLFGGPTRKERPLKVPLAHGDVVVWGGAARLRYHGVEALKHGVHPLLGERRINLTFRKAG
ncbi:DNA oxidative demethylase AlkB [Variovorax sp. J22R133]|uniref:DNA oxidative demethylase AlkB n=1 Tax=Variovorax brevis TaxID=3053503 RepID=UPI0025781554|nr:DNA oxidative demethylase AlkB [Variovorax sp. J22R133]MDM0110618.1 DNA oxidative demethylase AlkB [Variovorax sp. J22R133]